MSASALLAVEDSVLVVIDVQPPFLAKLAEIERQPLLQRVCWLVGVAAWLQVPLVVTAEDMAQLGGVDPLLAAVLPADTLLHNKLVFGVMGDPAIAAAVAATGRRTAVLVGLETDVCVAQSALGLLEAGYRVVVVADATGSPGTGHSFGLDRLRGAGVVIVGVKNLYYEWVRTVARSERRQVECPGLGTPPGIML